MIEGASIPRKLIRNLGVVDVTILKVETSSGAFGKK